MTMRFTLTGPDGRTAVVSATEHELRPHDLAWTVDDPTGMIGPRDRREMEGTPTYVVRAILQKMVNEDGALTLALERIPPAPRVAAAPGPRSARAVTAAA